MWVVLLLVQLEISRSIAKDDDDALLQTEALPLPCPIPLSLHAHTPHTHPHTTHTHREMAGGDLGAQQLPQRRRVVDFVRLLDATEKTLEQGVLASARPGDRAYLLELNRLHVVRFVGRGGKGLCISA